MIKFIDFCRSDLEGVTSFDSPDWDKKRLKQTQKILDWQVHSSKLKKFEGKIEEARYKY